MPVIINGTTGISGVDGSAASPAIEGSDANTGMFFPAADTIAFAEGGVEVLRMNSSTQIEFLAGTSSLPTITTSGDLNTGMFFPAADTIAFANGGTEEFRFGPAGQLGIQGANYGTSGQVLTSGGASASPSWGAINSMVLLGTLTTTSGASQSLTGLTLTSYKQITLVFVGVSHNDAGSQSYLVGTSTADDVAVSTTFGNTATVNGFVFIALSSGTFSSALSNSNNAATVLTGTTPLRTSSTSISVAPLAGSFDAGSILVYGIQ
jgi:hypothetical protein